MEFELEYDLYVLAWTRGAFQGMTPNQDFKMTAEEFELASDTVLCLLCDRIMLWRDNFGDDVFEAA